MCLKASKQNCNDQRLAKGYMLLEASRTSRDSVSAVEKRKKMHPKKQKGIIRNVPHNRENTKVNKRNVQSTKTHIPLSAHEPIHPATNRQRKSRANHCQSSASFTYLPQSRLQHQHTAWASHGKCAQVHSRHGLCTWSSSCMATSTCRTVHMVSSNTL